LADKIVCKYGCPKSLELASLSVIG